MATREARARYALEADDETKDAFDAVQANMNQTGRAAKVLSVTLVTTLAAAFTGITKKVIDSRNAIEELSREMDLTVGFLSEMRGASREAGIEFTDFVGAMNGIRGIAQQVNDGVHDVSEALFDLGINMREFVALNPESQFRVLIEGLRRLGSGAEQTRLAEVLGIQDLVRFADLTSEAFQRLIDKQADLGNRLKDDQTDAAQRVSRAWAELINILDGVAQDSFDPVIESTADLAEKLVDELEPALQAVRKEMPRIQKAADDMHAAFIEIITFDFDAIGKRLFEGSAVERLKKVVKDEVATADITGLSSRTQRGVILAGARDIKREMNAIFTQDEGALLFGDDFKNIDSALSAIRALINAQKGPGGSAAEIDTSLQSLSGTIESSDDAFLRKLDDLALLLQQRETDIILKDIRTILNRPQNQSIAAFGA